jgi:hypothetical protein
MLWWLACVPEPDPNRPDLVCPGDDACPSAEGELEAGAASKHIEPSCFESWVDADENAEYDASVDTFLDCGCDRRCPGDDGYLGSDTGEADGTFQATWIAGFGNARAAMGVRGDGVGLRGDGDGQWGRAVVLRQGETTVGIVALDLVGWFHDDVEAARQAVRDAGLDLDHLVIHSTHDHQAPDTMGLWGKSALRSGYDEVYRDELIAHVVELVSDASGQLTPVTMTVGEVAPSTYSTEKGITNVVGDTRDPWVIDDHLGVIRLATPSGDTVATLVNWANHPETRGSDNTLISGDYLHGLCATVEAGVRWESRSREGLGGVCVYLNGTVGGMMTALRVSITDPDGHTWSEASWEKADANGQIVGEMVLDAVERGEAIADPALGVRVRKLKLPMENIALQAMYLSDVVTRSTTDWDPEQPIDDANTPWIFSEVDLIDLGPVQIATLPGEILPELAIGGYDGSELHAPGVSLVKADNPAPPDLSAAPAGPYLKDRLTGRYRWVVSLGNDEIGYVIPAYDFVVSDQVPYLFEAEGDHYEETVSLGPSTAARLDDALAGLAGWTP